MSDLANHLRWALSKIEFPLVYEKMPEGGEMGWKACPGCRVIWTRDMVHKPNCFYVAAKRFLGEEL